jgi:protein gp37
MYRRFGWPDQLSWYSGLVGKYGLPQSGSKIFACSTIEMFHPNIPKMWRDWLFEDIEKYPDLTFIILTKRPERIDRPMPPNVWLGVSVTGESMWEIYRTSALAKVEARIKFVSLEPILGEPRLLLETMPRLNWIIAGRLTGHGEKHDPARDAIEAIVEYGRVNGIPVFLKNNLKGIWPGPLIQEYPALPDPDEKEK